jgi:hypothetical protein
VTVRRKLFWGVVVVALIAIGVFIWKTRDPLDGHGPDVMAYLTEERTLCENKVQELQAKAIDGTAEYEKAQAADHACIGYLVGVVDQGSSDKEKTEERFRRLRSESVAFRNWAAQQLQIRGAEKDEFDPIAMASAALKLLDGQEQARRKAVKDSLEKAKFRSWNDIKAVK